MASRQCKLYDYTPSIPLAVVAVILFSALAAIHTFRMIQARVWASLFFVIGGLVELAGYTVRLFFAQDTCNRTLYGAQEVLLLLGPTILMFSVNMMQTIFTQTIGGASFCWVPIKYQGLIYFMVNTILFIAQAIGGAMSVAQASIEKTATGIKLKTAIFVIQIVFWGFTFVENIHIMSRVSRHRSEAIRERIPKWKYWNQLFGLAISVIALGRNVMRLTMDGGVEFLNVNEWPSYAFDGYQMVVVMGAWAIWYLPEKCHEALCKGTYIELNRRV